MFQQIVVDPTRSRCAEFGLHYWLPQISQSEGFVVDFSVVWGEVIYVCVGSICIRQDASTQSIYIYIYIYGIELVTLRLWQMCQGRVMCMLANAVGGKRCLKFCGHRSKTDFQVIKQFDHTWHILPIDLPRMTFFHCNRSLVYNFRCENVVRFCFIGTYKACLINVYEFFIYGWL